jgi:hypothetical protein
VLNRRTHLALCECDGAEQIGRLAVELLLEGERGGSIRCSGGRGGRLDGRGWRGGHAVSLWRDMGQEWWPLLTATLGGPKVTITVSAEPAARRERFFSPLPFPPARCGAVWEALPLAGSRQHTRQQVATLRSPP